MSIGIAFAAATRVLMHESWHYLARRLLRIESAIWIPVQSPTSNHKRHVTVGDFHIGWPFYERGATEPWPLAKTDVDRLGTTRISGIALAAPIGMLLLGATAFVLGLTWMPMRFAWWAAAIIWLLDSGGNVLPNPKLALERRPSTPKGSFDTTDGGVVSLLYPETKIRLILTIIGFSIFASTMFIFSLFFSNLSSLNR